MYFVKYGSEYLHDPRTDKYVLLELSFETEENSCGYCDFTIYPDHPMYSKLKERDADNPVEVYENDTLLFSGFIYELGKEFYLDGHVKCKGELDYLSESIVRPYSTFQRGYGTKVPDTINEYFDWLIKQHNEQVNSNKQFKIGINQGSLMDSFNYINSSNDKYPTTINEISEKLLNNLGGYLVTRHEDGIRYIDYLKEWTNANTQILDFGVNLTDYSQTEDSSEIATFIVPLGSKMSDTEYEYNDGYRSLGIMYSKPVDPNKDYYIYDEEKGEYSKCNDLEAFEKSVIYYEYIEENDESDMSLTINNIINQYTGDDDYIISGDLIYCKSAVERYGWIGATYEDTEITVKEDLVSIGIIALKDMISPKRTIEIKAVDMHFINPDMSPIRVGEYVRIRSAPHGVDSYFLCRNIELDLNNPENSIYTLGTTFDTLTGQQNKRIKSLNDSINFQYEEAIFKSSKAIDAASVATQTAQNATAKAEEAQETADNAIASSHEEYVLSNSATEPPTEGWNTEDPSDKWVIGQYIWKRWVYTYANGSILYGNGEVVKGIAELAEQKADNSVIIAGEAQETADNAITEGYFEYTTSLTPEEPPTEGWSTDTPEYTSGVFIWQRYIAKYGNGSTITGNPVLVTGNSGSDGEDAVLLRIESSRGTVFKNNSISTTLSVVIYKGKNRITDIDELHSVFGSSAYLQWYWQRINDNTFGIISLDDMMIGNNGFTLTISPDKVDSKVTFMCELIT